MSANQTEIYVNMDEYNQLTDNDLLYITCSGGQKSREYYSKTFAERLINDANSRSSECVDYESEISRLVEMQERAVTEINEKHAAEIERLSKLLDTYKHNIDILEAQLDVVKMIFDKR